MANVVGLINLHSNVSLKGLTERRPVASGDYPLAGRGTESHRNKSKGGFAYV